MRSGLAFSIVLVMEHKILFNHEVFAVGNQAFRIKAQKRIHDMVITAKSVFIILHQANVQREQFEGVIWLKKGQKLMNSDPKTVLKSYSNYCKDPNLLLQNSNFNFASL
jgi:lipopolysaccharide transport system ATP-binding protein